MIPISTIVRAMGIALLAPLAVACVVESSSPPPPRQSAVGGGTTPAPAPAADAGTGAPSATPLLVDVDTNQTMTAAPGQGVGVFTEYTAGGHWHVWWTCDTAVNPAPQPCAFDVKVSVQSGAITNAKGENLSTTDALATPSPQQIEITTSTTTEIDGVLFDTAPGAIITLDASMNGMHDGGFLFFVQAGKVNGGYSGTLTNPLMLEGSSP